MNTAPLKADFQALLPSLPQPAQGTPLMQAGDILYVPAGTPHRFENFSPDFVTWVVFYGPSAGKQP